MRTPYIAGNWKLNKTIGEAKAFVQAFKDQVADVEDVDMGLGAQFIALPALAAACKGSRILVGAQDCYWEESGAFTGEVAPSMIKDAGCQFTIIGHSERRQYFGETNETVNKKVKAALAAGLSVIVCVGERLEERDQGITEQVIRNHVQNGLVGLTAEQMQSVTVAYEPVWAIGTGKTATPDQAQEAHACIRGLLKDMFGSDTAEATRIQYGGSVKPENVQELMAQPDVDGALVGGASLKPDSFAKIVKFKCGCGCCCDR
jgi:triosephosphate isomerase